MTTPPVNAPVIRAIDLSLYPALYQSVGGAQPFSQRAGSSWAEQVEAIKNYLIFTLQPHLDLIDTNHDQVLDALAAALAAQNASIGTQLQTVLAQIIAGENVTLNDGSVLAAIQSLNSVTLAYLNTVFAPKPTAFGSYLLAGTGIDLTGATDSTTAVNAFLAGMADGSVVTVPSGATIKLTGQVLIGHRIHLNGAGTLEWSAGVASQPALYITANGTTIEGVRMHTSVLPAQTGDGKQAGIAIHAHNVTVTNVIVDSFQGAIAVDPFGEWYGAIITNNHVLNVPGSGDGATNTSSNLGEDRGDGITVWGAGAIVTGNRVTAAVGTDARIGIHCEALNGSYEAVPGLHPDSMVLISDNVIEGKFRRGIVAEEISDVLISNNIIADPTWWGIALIGGDNQIVRGNVINWTRTANDQQGAAWSVNRAGIMVYGHGINKLIDGNTIRTSGSLAVMPSGVYAFTSGNGAIDGLTITGNIIRDPTNTMSNGMYLNGGSEQIVGLVVEHNNLYGYTNLGIYSWNGDTPFIRDNRLAAGLVKHANGIVIDGNGSGARLDGNYIQSSDTAIKCYNRFSLFSALNNMIYSANIGIDYYGTAAQSGAIANNVFQDVTNKNLSNS